MADSIHVKLPDGSVKDIPKGTTALDVAKSISPRLADAALAAKTNGDLIDLTRPEEIFGPVLAVIKSKNFDDALRIANGTEFGLTGAIYTSSEEKIERAMHEFHVGNLYINRKCTGAIVGAHPFGGFNMSGTDSKAGGPDYLYLFTQAKSIGKKIV